MTRLDSNTEAILKRVDGVLESFERKNALNSKNHNKNSAFLSPMSVSRNECGVDIHLPHGLLRSTALSDRKTQYSLMTVPNTLVLQKTLPADGISRKSTSNNSISSSDVTGEELATLIQYGSQYLDTYDTANRPSLLSATNRLIVEKDSEKSLSSLDDLEKVVFFSCKFTEILNLSLLRNFNVLSHLTTPSIGGITHLPIDILFIHNHLLLISTF